MMNHEFIEEIERLIRALTELKNSSIISMTYRECLSKQVRGLWRDINYHLKIEKNIRRIKK